jgi:hypothetical protein
VIRRHLRQLARAVDARSLPARVALTVGALLSLPLLGTAARTLGSALGPGWLTVPLLAVAHVPLVVALLGLGSIGADLRRRWRASRSTADDADGPPGSTEGSG